MTPRIINWRTSSYSTAQNNCVEVADTNRATYMRDSKHPDDGHLTFAPSQVAALVTAARDGHLDVLTG